MTYFDVTTLFLLSFLKKSHCTLYPVIKNSENMYVCCFVCVLCVRMCAGALSCRVLGRCPAVLCVCWRVDLQCCVFAGALSCSAICLLARCPAVLCVCWRVVLQCYVFASALSCRVLARCPAEI